MRVQGGFILRWDIRSDSIRETAQLSGVSVYNFSTIKVELLSRVFDHSTGKYLKEYRMLALGWSDGNSFLEIDFELLSSANKKNHYNEINPDIDKITCGYQRRKEAITKSTELLEPMVKRSIQAGLRAKYLVFDSWFSMPSVIWSLRQHIDIICMLKDHPKWRYEYGEKKLRLKDLYGKLKKKRGYICNPGIGQIPA